MTAKSKKDITDIGKSLIVVILTLIASAVFSKYNSYASKDYVDRENKAQDELNEMAHKNLDEKIDKQGEALVIAAEQINDMWKLLVENNGKKD